jgi:predicted RNase H-like HicB family nuclease
MRKFRVTYDLDVDGFWTAKIPEIPGCISDGRSIAEARRNIREAIECCIDVLSEHDASTAELIDDVHLPRTLQKPVNKVNKLRAQLDEQSESLTKQMIDTITLLETSGLSTRDIGYLLHMSHQRIHQLVERVREKQNHDKQIRSKQSRGKSYSG